MATSRTALIIRHTLLQAAAAFVLLAAHAAAQPAADPFADRAWHLELGGHVAIETWNYNISHEEMRSMTTGFTYGLGRGLALKVSWPAYYVDQRGVDAWLLGATCGLRGRVVGFGRASAYWEFEVGVSEADTFTPPRGTRFNYLAMGGAGIVTRVRDRVHLLTGLKWVHLSNNSLAGRSRNPDIEAIGPQVALLIGF